MNDKKTVILFSSSIIASFLLVYVYFNKQQQTITQSPAPSKHLPRTSGADIVVYNATLNTPTKTTTTTSITMRKATIYRKSNIIACQHVICDLTQHNKLQGTITAPQAMLDKQKNSITFSEASGTINELSFSGSDIIYNITNNFVITNKPLTITTKQATITAQQATLDVARQHLTLNNQVKTVITISCSITCAIGTP